MLESVDRHQQLDDSVRDRRARGLDHKHVRLTDVLIDLDEHVLVGETDESRAAEVGPQTFADGLGQFWMSGAADDLDSRDHVAPPCARSAAAAAWAGAWRGAALEGT